MEEIKAGGIFIRYKQNPTYGFHEIKKWDKDWAYHFVGDEWLPDDKRPNSADMIKRCFDCLKSEQEISSSMSLCDVDIDTDPVLPPVKISAFINYYRGVVIDYQTRIQYLESLISKEEIKV